LKKTFYNFAGLTLGFDQPKIMGIVNLDKASFYNGSTVLNERDFLNRAERMLDEGADIIDIGASTSRPGSSLSKVDEELDKIIPLLKKFKSLWPKSIVSIDTYHSEVARFCLEEGANMINDISAGNIDSKLIDVCAQYNIPYVLMHMRGLPDSMQNETHYDNVIEDIFNFFEIKINECNKKGLQQIILDPGLGFGKSLEGNYTILKKMTNFRALNYPLLMGLSRKSFIQKLINVQSDEALNASTALHMLALENGANILRVHDVKEAKETINIWNYYAAI
jgi:dihydropteroate synthase